MNKRALIGVLFFVSFEANAQNNRSEIRDSALQIAGSVGASSLPENELSEILDQLNSIKARLSGLNPSGALFCEAYNSVYSYLSRVSDGLRLTDLIDAKMCSDAVRAAKNNLVCAPYNSAYSNLVNFNKNIKLNDSFISVEDCAKAVSTSTLTLVCSPYNSVYSYLSLIDDGSRRSSLVSTDDCIRNLH